MKTKIDYIIFVLLEIVADTSPILNGNEKNPHRKGTHTLTHRTIRKKSYPFMHKSDKEKQTKQQKNKVKVEEKKLLYVVCAFALDDRLLLFGNHKRTVRTINCVGVTVDGSSFFLIHCPIQKPSPLELWQQLCRWRMGAAT